MGKYAREAMLFGRQKYLEQLEIIKAMMEEVKQEGRTEEEAKAIKKRVREIIDNLLDKTEAMLDRTNRDDGITEWDFSRERKEELFAEDDVIKLRPFQTKDKDIYITLEKENIKLHPTGTEEEKFWEEVWEETKFLKRLPMVVVLKESDTFIGYIGLKNSKRRLWEIEIELLEKYHCQGYGTRAVSLFLKRLYEITGKQEYQFKVEIDTLKCQGMLRHFDAKLVGMENLFFNNEEDAWKFEEEHLEEIDEHMEKVAALLNVEPRKMLSHVLDYRVYVEDMR